jgi:hypothetical protein
VGLILLAVLADACAAPGAPTAAPSAAPAATPTSAATASDAAIATPAASPVRSVPAPATCASNLRFCLPDQFAVLPLVVERLDPAKFLAGTAGGRSVQAFVVQQGKAVDDLEVATAREVTGTVSITFFAFRLRGVDAVTLGDTFANAAIAAGENVERATVLGRVVARYSGEGRVEYLYPNADVLYGIRAGTEEIANDALAVLP